MTPQAARQLGESIWDWAHRSDEATVKQGLAQLGVLIEKYPEIQRPQLVLRLQSPHDHNHESALFELYLYGLFTDCGYAVTPEVEIGSGTVPDLLLADQTTEIAYIEATLIRGNRLDQIEDDRVYRLFDQVSDYIVVPGFCVMVDSYVSSKINVSPRRVAAFLNRWFAEVANHPDPIELRRFSRGNVEVEGGGEDCTLTTRTFTDDTGWSFNLTLWPMSSRDVKPQRVWASFGPKVRHVDNVGRLRTALESKLKQHGRLSKPLLVAVASTDRLADLDDDDVADTMLGRRYWEVSSNGGMTGACRRYSDGAWCNPKSKMSERIAGLIVCNDISISKLPSMKVSMWCNPWIRPAVLSRWKCRQVSWDEGGNPVVVDGAKE